MMDACDTSSGSRLVLIVCSQLFREAIVNLLDKPGIDFTDGMKTIDEAVEYMQNGVVPALAIVVLIDENATEVLNTIHQTRQHFPSVRWLILTDSTSPSRFRQAMAAGVHGLLKHEISVSVLKHAAELLLLGQSLLPVGLGEFDVPFSPAQPVDQFSQSARPLAEADQEPQPTDFGPLAASTATPQPVQLSTRERQILECLAQGDPNKLIARKLAITDATVKVHVKALLRKLRMANRTQLAVSAFRNREPLDVAGDLPTMDVSGEDSLNGATQQAANGRPLQRAPSLVIELKHVSDGRPDRQD
jgi:two-component system nitrate/nitrite response regulator NarL